MFTRTHEFYQLAKNVRAPRDNCFRRRPMLTIILSSSRVAFHAWRDHSFYLLRTSNQNKPTSKCANTHSSPLFYLTPLHFDFILYFVIKQTSRKELQFCEY